MIGLAERGQRQRVGRGAVEDEVHFALGLKEAAKRVGRFGRPRVVAIRRHVPAIGGFHRLPRFGADSRVVVAGKLLLQFFFVDFCHGNNSSSISTNNAPKAIGNVLGNHRMGADA